MGNSDVKVHFSIWRKQIMDYVEKNYGGDPDKVPVKFKDNDKFVLGKNSGFHIINEDGRWRMNEH